MVKKTQAKQSPPANFPLAQYTSIVGVHTSLLAFTALFLPQSTSYSSLIPGKVAAQSSLDHPQHPFLDPITANPIATLLALCTGSMILQGWWGGWLRKWWIELTVEGSEEERKLAMSILLNKKASSILRAWITVFAASTVVHAAIVLLGAPITSHVPCTYLLSLLLSILCFFPPAYVLGAPSLSSGTEALVNRMTWTRLFAEISIRNAVERALVYPMVGSFVGCWVGAIPIALDWDRPWQAWPLTPAFGAVGGYIAGSMTALTTSAVLSLAELH